MANVRPGQPAIINIEPPEQFIRRNRMDRIIMINQNNGENRQVLRNFVVNRVNDPNYDHINVVPPINRPNVDLVRPNALIGNNRNLPINRSQKNEENYLDPQSMRMLEEIFPKIDIPKVLQIYLGQVTLGRISEFVLNNEQTMPKKETLKRKADTKLEETMNSIYEDEPEEGTKILDIVLKKLAAYFSKANGRNPYVFNTLRLFLGIVFYKLRLSTIDCFIGCGNLKSMLIFGFFLQNGLHQEFRKYVNSMETNRIWGKDIQKLFLQNYRRRRDIFQLSFIDYQAEFDEFLAIMKRLQIEYPHILNGIDLKDGAHTHKYEPTQESEQFECGVCFDSYSISKRVMCGKHNGIGRHEFCINCVRQQADVATGEMPLAEGAVGLKCMDSDCKNPIYYALIRNILPSAIRKRMDDRIQEENLAVSGLNLERCKNCNFAAEMNVDKNINKVFDCLSCGKQWCRSCDKEWNDQHFGLSCEEYARKSGDQAKRNLETKLSEAVVRKCHRCNCQFMKNDGCNKITCRCGATQCYICRQKDINYDHFCQHVRDPITKSCDKCKKCGLWYDPTVIDKAVTEQIQQEARIQIQVPDFAPLKVNLPSQPRQVRPVPIRPPVYPFLRPL